MTEAEAKTKWCPFARSYIELGGDNDTAATVNRAKDGAPDAYCLCIASACMAWCWVDPGSPKSGYCGMVNP